MPPGIGYGSDAVMRQRPQPRERRFDMSMGIPPGQSYGNDMRSPMPPGGPAPSAIDGAIQGMQGQLGFGGGAIPGTGGQGIGQPFNPGGGVSAPSWGGPVPPGGLPPNYSSALMSAFGGLQDPERDARQAAWVAAGSDPNMSGRAALARAGAPSPLSVGPLPGAGNPNLGSFVGQPVDMMNRNPNIPPQLKAIFDRLSAGGGPIGADAKFQPVTGGGLQAGPVGSMQGGTANWTPELPPSRPKAKARSKKRPNSGDKSGVGILKRQDAVKKRQKRLMKVTA